MTLPITLVDREFKKFEEYDSQVAVRVKSLNSLVTEKYNYISVAYPTTVQEVYTFKSGGSGGTTVATVTVNYTTSSKEFVSNVSKT
jgi:hypothetical protein